MTDRALLKGLGITGTADAGQHIRRLFGKLSVVFLFTEKNGTQFRKHWFPLHLRIKHAWALFTW